jgi:hypothetical protein
MKITSVDLGRSSAAGREKRVVTVRVKLGQPQETMRITVVVPEESDERLALEYGMARAIDAARQFCSHDGHRDLKANIERLAVRVDDD